MADSKVALDNDWFVTKQLAVICDSNMISTNQ